jgi:type IV pilus assembly protein PilE
MMRARRSTLVHVLATARPRRARSGRAQRGVTLMELLVVLIIVALLGTIAVSSYRSYVVRAGRSEAKVALLAAQQNLERCFTRFSSYLPVDEDDCPVSRDLQGDGITSQEQRYVVTSADIDETTYTLVATPTAGGGMASDPDCDTLTITQAGQRGATPAGNAALCWR